MRPGSARSTAAFILPWWAGAHAHPPPVSRRPRPPLARPRMTAIAAEQGKPIAHKQVLVVFSGLVLAMLLAALDSTIVSTALPTIVSELGGLAHLSWVVTAYLLAQTVVTPLYGKL